MLQCVNYCKKNYNLPALAINFPFGLKAKLCTDPLCPGNNLTCCPVDTHHNLIVLSALPVAI